MLNKIKFVNTQIIFNKLIGFYDLIKSLSIIFNIFLFTLLLNSNLYSESGEVQPEDIIEWSAIKASSGYQIQIRNTKKKVIVDEKTSDTKFKIQIPEGTYELRIGVYNKFSKIVGYSEWEKITVKKVMNPIVSVNSDTISEDSIVNKPLKIAGDNFTVDTKIEFHNGSEKIFPDEIKFINERELEVYFKNQIPMGSYDLIVSNPRNKKIKKENYLSITKPKEVVQTRAEESEESNQTPEIVEKKKISYEFSLSNLARSAVLPGWGQFNKDEKLKSFVIGGVFLAGGVFYNSEYSKYNSTLSKYNSDANLGLAFAFSSPVYAGKLVALNYFQNTQNFQKVESQLNTVNQIGLGLQMFYLYNLIDASISGKNIEKEQGLKIFAEETLQVYSPGLINRGFELGLKYDF